MIQKQDAGNIGALPLTSQQRKEFYSIVMLYIIFTVLG
jgi:hypothetical protein